MLPCLMASILNILFYSANDEEFRSGIKEFFTFTTKPDETKVRLCGCGSTAATAAETLIIDNKRDVKGEIL